MRSYDEYKQILELWELGINKKAISRYTGIPRGTIIDCIKRYETVEKLMDEAERAERPLLLKILTDGIESQRPALSEAYAYLFGLYLGDGSIVKMRRVYRLRVSLDAKYPNIIADCTQAIQLLFPKNQIGQVQNMNLGKLSSIDVSLYHKDLPLFFPQHALGKKHQRKIELQDWQERIICTYPLAFWKGLYHSDGSRFDNVVNGKAYPRYQFTNTSTDIAQIFSDTCDRLGIHWTSKTRPSKHNIVTDIFISKRKDVAYLDSVIGPKS